MRYKQISENYSPSDDKHNQIDHGDTRKSRLTLMHLNKLRKIREYRKVKNQERMELVSKMYGKSSDEEGGLGME